MFGAKQRGRRGSLAPWVQNMPLEFQVGLCAALCSMPPREQFVFRTVYMFGLTASRVARMVGVSRETIARILRQVDRRIGKAPFDMKHVAPPRVAWAEFLPGMRPWDRRKVCRSGKPW